MNNVKSLSIILLLSLAVVPMSYAKNDCNDDCSTRCSTDCNDNSCFDDCDDSCLTSTFLRPRQDVTNLTLLNNLTFYNRNHDARCSFFTWNSTIFYHQNRREECLGVGFFGANPAVFSNEEGADLVASNFGLGITSSGENFESRVSLCPQRKVVGWLSNLYFNLDCFCTGTWFDVTFAVEQAKHRLNFCEDGNEGNLAGQPTTVAEALGPDGLNCFSNDCKHTGLDDVMFRLGYDYNWCGNDTVGVYFLGIAPTGKSFNNAHWFQPLVGSNHGAVGFGLRGDYCVWNDECSNTDLVFQTELLYQYRLRHDERRVFDYTNGTWSRGLLVVSESNTEAPESGYDALISCVSVEPRSQLEWWANLHYQWCNWGAEFSYNLWWRQREKIRCSNFDFGDPATGIFDNSNEGVCNNNPTTGSNNTICTLPTQGEHDASFVRLSSSDVNLCSGAAQKVLTHTVSGAFSYNNVWCDCYPWYVGFGGLYEFASNCDRRHALENWGVYGKWGISW